MPERKWSRMPTSYGPHWFCDNLQDREIAEIVRVAKVECVGKEVYFKRMERNGRIIEQDQGWWLAIPDDRRTAKVET